MQPPKDPSTIKAPKIQLLVENIHITTTFQLPTEKYPPTCWQLKNLYVYGWLYCIVMCYIVTFTNLKTVNAYVY